MSTLKRKGGTMRKPIVFFIALLCVSTLFVVVRDVHTQDEPAAPPIPAIVELGEGLEYSTFNDRMIIRVPVPMLNDRFGIYGNVIEDQKTGQRKVNVAEKEKVTQVGMEIRDRIMSLSTDRGLFLVFSCTLGYNSITIFKYGSISWEVAEPEIVNILGILKEKE
jgi:hypothetical protein